MATYLDDLLAGAHDRVRAVRDGGMFGLVHQAAEAFASGPRHRLRAALDGEGVSVIAEVKRASPSKGDLAPGADASELADHYLAGGASAISVLTEPSRFKGSLEDLREVVDRTGAVALRKDFVVHPLMVQQAAAVGASGVLLIVAALDDDQLASMHAEAERLGMDALVEVHDESEVERATAIGATIIGINARDLRTFELDREAFARIRSTLPDGVLAVAESGIRDPDDVRRARDEGADAVLVGESVVTADDRTAAVAALVAAGRSDG